MTRLLPRAWSVALAIMAFVALGLAGAARALEASESPEEPLSDRDRLLEESGTRFRLDAEIEHYDTEAVSSEALFLGFTAVVAGRHALRADVSVGDSNLEQESTEGFGDTTISYSWSGGVPIDASPWLPRTFGPGISLLIPTGDPDDALGFGSWVAIPTLGTLLSPRPDLGILPGLFYAHSLHEREGIAPVRILGGSVNLLWIHRAAFWLTYIPKLQRDLETEQNTVSHELAVGYRFSHHFAGSLGYEAVIVGDAANLLGTRERAFDFILNVSF